MTQFNHPPRNPIRRWYQKRSSDYIKVRHVSLRARSSTVINKRIVLASDIHARDDWFNADCVRDLANTINTIDNVDLVALTGDFVGDEDQAMAWAAPILGTISAPTFAVLGNHDHWTDPRFISDSLENAGITMLTNRNIRLPDSVVIAGLDSCWPGKTSTGGPDTTAAFAGVTSDDTVVVLGHEPHLATLHTHWLHLAGHTHCGQARTPIFGNLTARLHMPEYSMPYPCWLYALSNPERFVYTTAGVGYSTVDFRLFCPPEIIVLDV